ncbi:MAG: MBOAT family protein [Ruminococcaceae bacterium]|nr:MBOAT family protein [Oscillospiraceae bacterium]
MVFSELIFIYAFLPLNLIIYFLAKNIHVKNTVLLLFSLMFYAWGEPVFVLLLVGMAFVNWLFSLWIGVARARGRTGWARFALVLSCIVSLGAIGVFKYGTFIMENLRLFTGYPSVIPHILLPIGISFYTFQLLSYVVDVYRGEVPPQRKFHLLLLYVSLFHQCIAGPIVRYQDVSEELLRRTTSFKDMSEGITRFTVGFAKKALLANQCDLLAKQFLGLKAEDTLEALSMTQITALPAAALWASTACYMLMIYLDFSAYSDMAIGMGRMVGFHYKENFNYPYISQSVTDFWRRWHMSLSGFFRDYVYIPLGGNRCSKGRQLFNMLVVWALTGLWHGASWNFVLWGLYFFVFLALEKLFFGVVLDFLPRIFRHVYLLAVVLFGWILFRVEDLSQVWAMVCGMFGANGNAVTNFETNTLLLGNCIFLAVAILACTPLVKTIGQAMADKAQTSKAMLAVHAVVQIAAPLLLLLLGTAMLIGNSYNPFLYFRF